VRVRTGYHIIKPDGSGADTAQSQIVAFVKVSRKSLRLKKEENAELGEEFKRLFDVPIIRGDVWDCWLSRLLYSW
jgi:hypothetical protein